ncbi:MAG: pantetheine-phosphate adenylyltransferase [Bacteroidetes bacterium]|nr:MAG: pantetheine-phosphate adenylyltransferase [Bacteroidota bacterium]
MRKALFPGSFDPITRGHVEIVLRGRAVFDEIIVAIGINSSKRYLFSLEERLEMLEQVFAHEPQVRVAAFDGLTVNFAREQGAAFLLRGLRSPQDLSYEQPLELINKHMAPELEVVHLLSSPETAMISSTIVREVIRYGGRVEGLIPDEILEYVYELKYQKQP